MILHRSKNLRNPVAKGGGLFRTTTFSGYPFDMAVEKWIQFLRPGQYLSVAVDDDVLVTYGYARVLKPIENEDIFVEFFNHRYPKGIKGPIPTINLIAPIAQFQFEAARKLGWPASPRVGMLITNQITVPPVGQT